MAFRKLQVTRFSGNYCLPIVDNAALLARPRTIAREEDRV